MRRILGQKPSASDNQIYPACKSCREPKDGILERTILKLAFFIKTAVSHISQIGFGLLHDGHIQKHADLAKLVVGPKSPNATGRGCYDCARLLVPHALAIGAGANI